jgi:hypothetical protein
VDIEESIPVYPDALGKDVEAASEDKYVVEEEVIKDETSIVFVIVEKRTEVAEDIDEVDENAEEDKAEEVEEGVEVVEDVVMLAWPGGVGGSTPFLPPRSFAPADTDANGPAGAAAASSALIRSGSPRVQASTTERMTFISKVRTQQ